MRLLHTADLHLGKRVNDFPMLEDQRYILSQILSLVDAHAPDAVILAGDIFDKSLPSAEAVTLFDDFLVSLSHRNTQIFVLSGNHDSPDRIAYLGRLLEGSGVHLSPVYDGAVTPTVLTDAFGSVNLYMLPFIKPAHARAVFPDLEINSYTDAVGAAISAIGVDPAARNVLITHQFVTGAQRSESEEISVGGTDNIDASLFDDFDYVALGHIHGPQNIGSPRIRYAGSPLKYSFSEANHQKSVSLVELGEKGQLTVTPLPLTPLHDMKELRGTYAQLTLRSSYEGTTLPEDYVHITLTDEEDIPDAIGRLRAIYKRLMKLDYDNTRTRNTAQLVLEEAVERVHPLDLFGRFYESQNGQPLSPAQRDLVAELVETIWGGEA